MNPVTILWSAVAGACAMLAGMHLLVWLKNRHSWEHLFFPIAVLGVVGLAACELVTMSAPSPDVYAAGVRYAHLANLFGTAGILGFVHCHFGTGRRWLLWLALGLRVLAVITNFTLGESLHIASIQSLQQMTFWGERVTVLGEWQPNRWVLLGQASALATVIYVVDASRRLFHSGSREGKRRAWFLGGSLTFFTFFSSAQSGLVVAGVLKMPFLVSLPFLGMVMAMGYELSRDLLRSMNLSRDLDITEQRLAQAASAARLALWEWNIRADEIWVSAGGRMLYGVEPEGKIDFKRFAASIHPEDRTKVSRAIDAALAGPDPYAVDYRVGVPDGSYRWMAAGGRVERDGQGRAELLRGVSIDITDRKQAEDRFRLVIEAAPNAMVMIDAAGTITLVNAQAEAVFGYSREELLGQSLEALIPERLRGHHPGLREGYQAHPTARMMGAGRELHGRRKDGSEVPVEIGLNPIEMPEGRFVLASIIDISGRKQAELKSSRQQQELAHLSRISILGELAGALAHELNQPLAAILGNSQVGGRMLREEAADLGEVAAILDDVASDAKRAGGIIHGMRAMFKKEASTEAQPVDLNEAVTQVLSLLHSEIVSRKVKVELALAEGLPAAAAGRVEVQQVIMNLVLNGLDTMRGLPTGAKLWIATGRDGDQVEVTVQDGGPGIPAELMDRLFDPFVSTKHGGLGLGLTISRGIAERFRGKLLAENHPDGGAVFRLVLPMAAN